MIRRATVDDAEAIARLGKAVQSFHAKEMPLQFKEPDDGPEIIRWFREILGRPTTRAFVAEDQDATVGYVFAEEIVRPASVIRNAQRLLLIHHVAVDPDHRRKGHGRSLLERCMEEARKMQADLVELDVWTFNTRAQRFFSELGFANVRHHMSRTP